MSHTTECGHTSLPSFPGVALSLVDLIPLAPLGTTSFPLPQHATNDTTSFSSTHHTTSFGTTTYGGPDIAKFLNDKQQVRSLSSLQPLCHAISREFVPAADLHGPSLRCGGIDISALVSRAIPMQLSVVFPSIPRHLHADYALNMTPIGSLCDATCISIYTDGSVFQLGTEQILGLLRPLWC